MPSLSLGDVTPASIPSCPVLHSLPSTSICPSAWFQGATKPPEVGSTLWSPVTTHNFAVMPQLGL